MPRSPIHPAISVLMPFHNAARTIAETLDSIQAQSFAAFELIAVDDGSSDNSAAIVTARAHRDPRIHLLSPGRVGLVEALNTGLAKCRGELVARIDADDRMHPARLERQHATLRLQTELSLVGCQVRLFPAEEVEQGFQAYIDWQNACISPQAISNALYIESPIAHPSFMFRRDAIRACGAYRDGAFPEDYELLLRLHDQGHKLGKLEEVMVDWRESRTRLTRTDDRYSRDAFDRVRTHYLSRDRRLQHGRALAFWGAGRRSRRRAEQLLAHGFKPTVWIDIDPNKIGNKYLGAPVVEPNWLKINKGAFVLCYVNNRGAHSLIAEYLHCLGYMEGADYLMVG